MSFGLGYFYGSLASANRRLSAMLFGTGFLIGFTARASVLNAMLRDSRRPSHRHAPGPSRSRARVSHWPQHDARHGRTPQSCSSCCIWLMASCCREISLAVSSWERLACISSLYRFVLAVAIGALICFFIWTAFSRLRRDVGLSLRSGPMTAQFACPVDGAYGMPSIDDPCVMGQGRSPPIMSKA